MVGELTDLRDARARGRRRRRACPVVASTARRAPRTTGRATDYLPSVLPT